MWPRTDEERRRQRNCGFVAFCKRSDADEAKFELQETMVAGYVGDERRWERRRGGRRGGGAILLQIALQCVLLLRIVLCGVVHCVMLLCHTLAACDIYMMKEGGINLY